MPQKRVPTGARTVEPLRFAHPYFISAEPAIRDGPAGSAAPRLLDHIKTHLEPLPATRGRGVMTLASLIGKTSTQAIAATGTMKFHATGDTGLPPGPDENAQELVAQAMTSDFDLHAPATCPA